MLQQHSLNPDPVRVFLSRLVADTMKQIFLVPVSWLSSLLASVLWPCCLAGFFSPQFWVLLQQLSGVRKWNRGKWGIKAREAYWIHKSLPGWRGCCFTANGSLPPAAKSKRLPTTRHVSSLRPWSSTKASMLPSDCSSRLLLFSCSLF